MNEQLSVFEYISTYNTQNPDKLAEIEQAQLDKMSDEVSSRVGAGPDLEAVLNDVIEVQEDIAVLQDKILGPINTTYDEYKNMRDRCNKAKDLLNEHQDAGNTSGSWPHWALFNTVREARNDAYEKFETLGGYDALSEAWDQFKALVNDSKCLVGPNRQVWGMYFAIQKEELTKYFTYGGEDESYSNDSIDSRHASNDIIYGDTHVAEMLLEDADFNENPYLSRDWWDQYGFNKREDARLELASMQACMF